MLCWPTNQGISKVCGMCRSLFFHLIALVAKKLIERWNICICIWEFICFYSIYLFIYWMCRSVIIHLLVRVAKSWLRLEILRRGRSWRGINWHQLVKQTSKQDSIWSAPSEWEPGEVWKVLLNAPNLASLWDWRYKSGRELMGLSTCKL